VKKNSTITDKMSLRHSLLVLQDYTSSRHYGKHTEAMRLDAERESEFSLKESLNSPNTRKHIIIMLFQGKHSTQTHVSRIKMKMKFTLPIGLSEFGNRLSAAR